MRIRTRIASFIALTLTVTALSVADGVRFDEAWRWIQFTTASGLPSDRILDVVETDDGTVWALTTGGVAWYDGFEWNLPDERSGLRGKVLASLRRYTGDSVLITIEGTMFVGDRTGFRRLPIPEVYESAPFPPHSFIFHRRSSIYRFDNGSIALFEPPGSRTEGNTISLKTTKSGSIWAHLTDGLYRFDGGRWALKFPFGNGSGVIGGLAENDGGSGIVTLVFPKSLRGLWEWSGGGAPAINRKERPDNVRSIDVGPDDQGIVLYQSGALRIRIGGVWSDLTLAGVNVQDLNVVHFRKNLDVWFGTEHGLFLYRRSSSRWTFLRHDSPDLRNSVNEIVEGRDGGLWLATSDGIECYRNGRVAESFSSIGPLALDVVTGLTEDRDRRIWISSGSSFDGTYRWDGSSWQHFDVSPEDGGIRIHKIRQDHQGRLWFLGIGKISPVVLKRDPGAFEEVDGAFIRWGVEEGLPEGRVYAFDEGPDGSLWFGTSGGVSRWKPNAPPRSPGGPVYPKDGTWTHWTTAQGLRFNRVFTLAVDQENRAWFGDHSMIGFGLGMIDRDGSVRYVTTGEGLVNDNIWDIRVGADTTVWISTERGLSSFHHGRWSTFDIQSGLLHPTLWPVHPGPTSVAVGTQGSGVAILNLDESSTPEPRLSLDPPSMENRNVFVRWRAFAWWGELDPAEVPTRYRVNDGPWSAWTREHEVTLREPAPGEYVIQVQARGLFGGFREEGFRGSFTVPQPLYLRPAFYVPTGLLGLALAGLGVVMLARKRNHDIALRMSEEKFRTVTETTASAIFMVDGDRIVFANSAAEQLTGFSSGEMEGTTFIDIVHPDFRQAVARSGDGEASTLRYETKIVSRQGEERWLDCTAGAISLQGRRVQLIAAFEITERKRAEEKLRMLASELSLTEERERRRMANYLHDVIGQTLAIIKLKIRTIERTRPDTAFATMLGEVRELVDQSILNTQNLTFDLCPPILYELSFEAAVEWLTENMSRQHGLPIEFRDDRAAKPLSQDIRILLFQAVRELLVNVVKHAGAERASVSMGRDGSMIRIAVTDDGTGLGGNDAPPRPDAGGFGLFNIRERLTHFGGSLQFTSQPGKGTEVVVKAPLASQS